MELVFSARSEPTVAKILAAARRLFIAKNYAEVTMDQIGAAARVTKGALYHHFRSKEDLYLTVVHADLAKKKELFAAAVLSGGDCRSRLQRLTEAFYALPREERELIRLIRRDINVFKDPERQELVRAYQAALPQQVERIVETGIRDGELTVANARLVSWLFVAMVEVTLTPYAQDALDGTEQRLSFVLDRFFCGARASPDEEPQNLRRLQLASATQTQDGEAV